MTVGLRGGPVWERGFQNEGQDLPSSLPPRGWKGSKLYTHTCKMEVTLGLMLAHKLQTAPDCAPLNRGGNKSNSRALDGGTAHFCELLVAVLMQTPPPFPRGVKKGVRVWNRADQGSNLFLSLTTSVILEEPLILSELLFTHL